MAEHPGAAAVGAQQRGEDADRCRLAGAVRAEDAVDAAPGDGEGHAVDGARRAEGLDQPVRLDGQVADEFAALAGVEDLIGLISAEVADHDAIDPVLSRLMFEAMREAERDTALRERMGAMLAQYRELTIHAVRAEQERGAVFTGAPADAIATLLGAVGDGLLLHALLDPGLDVHAALNALRALLAPRPA
jgi:hypothetical protein